MGELDYNVTLETRDVVDTYYNNVTLATIDVRERDIMTYTTSP
jgi:hypothetical protein